MAAASTSRPTTGACGPVDFQERSLLGSIPDTTFADWPITYDELEPYYTKVDWEVGVSGEAGAREIRPGPATTRCPPMPIKSSGVLLRDGAAAAGYTSKPPPRSPSCRSPSTTGAPPCIHCGMCWGQAMCEIGAKSSSLSAMIPIAERDRPLRDPGAEHSVVTRVETNAGRAGPPGSSTSTGNGVEQAQAGQSRDPLGEREPRRRRLLFLSESSRHPDGLANSSGYVGKNLMLNYNPDDLGSSSPEPLNEYKSVVATRVVMDFYDADPAPGLLRRSGGIDARSTIGPLFWAALDNPFPGDAAWGAELQGAGSLQLYNYTMAAMGHGTSLPQAKRTRWTLDPDLTDAWGRPGI